MNARLTSIALCASTVLVLASCSGSDSSTNAPSEEALEVNDSDSASDPAPESDSDADADAVVAPDAPVDSVPTSDAPSGSADGSVCDRIDNLNVVIDRLDTADPSDEAGQVAAFQDFVRALNSIADVAPSGIVDDVTLLSEGFQLLAEFGAGQSQPTAEEIAFLDSDEYIQAGDRFEEFALDECDAVLG